MPNELPLLVPEDSPLRDPPDALNPRQKVGIDAIRYALDMSHLSFCRLYADIQAISMTFEANVSMFIRTCAVADAWAVVDNLWRLREVVNHTRGLRRTPELEAQLRALAAVKDFRDGIQHMHERFRACAESGESLLGTLSWLWTPDGTATHGQVFAMGTGSMRHDGPVPFVNPSGRMIHHPIDLVTLTAFGKTIELSPFWGRLTLICNGLDQGLRNAIACEPALASSGGSDVIARADVEGQSPANASPTTTAPSG